MKSFAVVFVFAQVAIFQSYAQCLRGASPFIPSILPSPLLPGPCGPSFLPPIVAAPPQTIFSAPPQTIISAPPSVIAAPPSVLAASPSLVIQPNSVANNLADTLSLLTVSSLLAESLPLNYPNVVSVPSCSPYASGLSYYI